MIRKGPNLLTMLALMLGVVLSCTAQTDKGHKDLGAKGFEKVETYTIRGRTVSYYRIPADLSREELVKTARKICDIESPGRLTAVFLILIDDVSGLARYVNWAKRASNGDTKAKPPKIWADKHIIANAQNTMNGGWMLYESNGYKEIAYLEPKTEKK